MTQDKLLSFVNYAKRQEHSASSGYSTFLI